jgi:glycerol uptake facilitator-like aquaporin
MKSNRTDHRSSYADQQLVLAHRSEVGIRPQLLRVTLSIFHMHFQNRSVPSLDLRRTKGRSSSCPLILSLKFIGTFILVFIVFAISDKLKHNSAIHPSLIPLVIFTMLILGIGAAFGTQTGTYNRNQDKLSSRFMVITLG